MKKDLHQILSLVERGAKAVSLVLEEGKTVDKALEFFFSSRFSSPHDLTSSYVAQICKQRKDYPSLERRSTHWIPSHGIKLAGYYYAVSRPKGIVLYVHGLRGQADDFYAIGQDYFVRHGYDVFAIDLSNSGRSTGQGIDSLSVGPKDVYNATIYLQDKINNHRLPVYLFGHSWGGYSVVGSTYFGAEVAGVASISGFSSPINEMIGLPSEKTGLPLGVGREELEEACRLRSDENYDLSAVNAIKMNPTLPYFISIGDKDITVPVEKSSIYKEAKALRLRNCEMHLEVNKGHMDILLSEESGRKRQEYIDYSKAFAKVHGSNFSKLNATERNEFFYNVDIEQSSHINERLFSEVLSFFERCEIRC